MKKRLLWLFMLVSVSLNAQNADTVSLTVRSILQDFKTEGYHPAVSPDMDSLEINAEQRFIKAYVNESFCSQTFMPEDIRSLYRELQISVPQPYNSFKFFIVSPKGKLIEEFIPNVYRENQADKDRLWGEIDYKGNAWVKNTSKPFQPSSGLQNRHIMLWPSHGRYYKNALSDWSWQRPMLFCTLEDIFTQSFVNPFLIPMLENAGAIVCSARERDIQQNMIVVDNDSAAFGGDYIEQSGETHQWSEIPVGFAHPNGLLSENTEPFRLGTARKVQATTRKSASASATWIPRIPERGNYAVYVSYSTLQESVPDARYTVYHKGGKTNFTVNQQMGGGTWVYLGTFAFDEGENQEGRVVLSNQSNHRGVVTADAVRFGGGMGQTTRQNSGTTGLPCFLEGARYHLQWAGLPEKLYNQFNGENDYNDDIRSRSNMLNFLGAGSTYMPAEEGGKVPFELSLAVHSDAGVRADNSIYGTLGICTTTDSEGTTHYPSGMSRLASLDLVNILLTTVTNDISAAFNVDWTRRESWDRNYGESRMPNVPSAILETMSHQNFGDLRYGHDPNFKFAFSRSIYKALLQFINAEHGIKSYIMQPLPVNSFSAQLSSDGTNRAILKWKPTHDPQNPSALPSHYILYTRTDDGGFDNGVLVSDTNHIVSIKPDTRYSFKVTAVNNGGESFPSETLSVYKSRKNSGEILIVNGFERLSGPAVIETADSLGFDLSKDFGVPYLQTTAFCGKQINFDRKKAGSEGPDALGYSSDELIGKSIAGNTFNYPEIHGEAISAIGKYSYSSCSRSAATEIDWTRFQVVDYLTGLEKNAPQNLKPYKVFNADIRKKIQEFCTKGGKMLINGAYIASDAESEEEKAFIRNTLKFEYFDTEATEADDHVSGLKLQMPIYREPNVVHYALQNSDVITPIGPDTFTAFVYSSGRSAGTAYNGNDYKVICMAFPFDAISDKVVRAKTMKAILKFLTR